MVVDTSRRLQAVHVAVSDGVRLAVDVWLPEAVTAGGGRVGTVMRFTRYHRAAAPSSGPQADSNRAAGDLWNDAGYAYVVVDARGTGASFGSRTGELDEREVADYAELVDWAGTQPWSNGRVGLWGSSYEGQAAELTARHGSPHLVAVAALFSPFDRLAALTGRPVEDVPLPAPVKPVDGPGLGGHLPGGEYTVRRPDAGARGLAGRRFRRGRVDAVRQAELSSGGRDRAVGPRRRQPRGHVAADRLRRRRHARPGRSGRPAGAVLRPPPRRCRRPERRTHTAVRVARLARVAHRHLLAASRSDGAARVPGRGGHADRGARQHRDRDPPRRHRGVHRRDEPLARARPRPRCRLPTPRDRHRHTPRLHRRTAAGGRPRPRFPCADTAARHHR